MSKPQSRAEQEEALSCARPSPLPAPCASVDPPPAQAWARGSSTGARSERATTPCKSENGPAECQDLSQHVSRVAASLQTLGMGIAETTGNARRMCSREAFRSKKPTVVELYGRGSLIDLANTRY